MIMAIKRKKVAAKTLPRKKTKTPIVKENPPIPKIPKPLPTELLAQIFRNLDVITATSFGLTNHKFRDIYLAFVDEIFRYRYNKPLCLETRITYPDGKSQTLKACLRSWIPAHLVYDNWAQRYVTLESLASQAEWVRELCEEKHWDKKAGRQERKARNIRKRKLRDLGGDAGSSDSVVLENEGDSDIELQQNENINEGSDWEYQLWL